MPNLIQSTLVGTLLGGAAHVGAGARPMRALTENSEHSISHDRVHTATSTTRQTAALIHSSTFAHLADGFDPTASAAARPQNSARKLHQWLSIPRCDYVIPDSGGQTVGEAYGTRNFFGLRKCLGPELPHCDALLTNGLTYSQNYNGPCI